jgi:uncharacterized membrane protein YkoI
MKPSKVLLLSVFISAIILVIIGAITSNVMADKISKAETPTGTSETIQTYQQREAEYNQLIQQANQQLADANAKLQALQNQAVQNQPVTQPSAANNEVAVSMAVSVDKAEQIARQAADAKSLLVKKPELVSFESKAAYEVAFQNGSIYVDAQTGDVLFNGTVPQEITKEKAVQIASDYLKNTDVVLADQITFRNAPLFRVVFKDGMMVYLDTTGQIVYILKSSMKAVVSEPQSGGGRSSAPSSDHGDFEGNDD